MCMHLAPENKKRIFGLDGNLFIHFFFVTRFNYLVVRIIKWPKKKENPVFIKLLGNNGLDYWGVCLAHRLHAQTTQ